MAVTLELSPEVEAKVSALAADRGVAVEDYLKGLIEAQVPVVNGPKRSIAERIALWEDVHNLPVTPLLSDEAISRENMYGPRG